jgi:hypothetical protein
MMEKFLKAHKGMQKIKPATSASCLENQELFVRKSNTRYEFIERGGQCGNFAVLHATITQEWVRKIRGGHSAISRVSPIGVGTYTLKICAKAGASASAGQV